MNQFEQDPLLSPRALLDLFYPGSFSDPLHLPIEPEKTASDLKPPGSLLLVSEVAMILGVTEDTIRKWAKAGKISSIRLSKVDLRFRPTDVDEFIGSRLNRRKSAFR